MKHLFMILILVGLPFLFTACDTADTGTDTQQVTRTIGSDGGTLEADDGSWSFEVPADALITDTEITITSRPERDSDVPEGYRAQGKIFVFEPSGLEFAEPALLTIPYEQGEMAEEGIEERLMNFYYLKDDSTVEKAPSTCNMTANSLQVEIHHFSLGGPLTFAIILVNSGFITSPGIVEVIADAVADEIAGMTEAERDTFYTENEDLLGPFIDRVDEILPSNPVSDILEEDTILPVPGSSGTVTTSLIKHNAVDITWAAASDNKTAAAALLYRVYHAPAGTDISTPALAVSNGTPSSDWSAGITAGSATGLDEETDYTVTVLVKDAMENTAAYSTIAVTTGVSVTFDWCSTQFPVDETIEINGTVPTIYGLAYIDGVTGSNAGPCEQIIAQIGYGPAGSNPITDPGWIWKTASFYGFNGNDDEFSAVPDIDTSVTGTYAFAYRFSGDFGDSWFYADADLGSTPTDPYDPENAGRLTVKDDITAPVPGDSGTITTSLIKHNAVDITWSAASDNKTAAAALLYRVYHAPAGTTISTPAQAVSNGTPSGDWSADIAAGSATGLDEETDYTVTVLVKDAMENMAAYSTIAITTKTTVTLDWWSTQWPVEATIEVNDAVPTMYGHAYIDLLTGGTYGPCDNIIAQVGYGPAGSNPITDTGWIWKNAAYYGFVGNNDEFYAIPDIDTSVTGTYAFAFRFSGDFGDSWVYGDTDGGSTSSDPYDSEHAGTLIIVNP